MLLCELYRMILFVQFQSMILSLVPIGLDGTIQLFTEYESTNIKRIVTGLIAGFVTGIALKIIADSLERN